MQMTQMTQIFDVSDRSIISDICGISVEII